MMETYSFTCPTQMEVGPGVLSKLPAAIESLLGSKIMLVTDPGVAQAGLLDKVSGVLDGKYSLSLIHI